MTMTNDELRDHIATAIFEHLRTDYAENGYSDVLDCAAAFGAPITTTRWNGDIALDADLVGFNGQFWTSVMAQAVLDDLITRGVVVTT